MMGFWIGGALAIVLVLALLFRPFLLKSSGGGISRRQLNAAIYRDQMARLDRDRIDERFHDLLDRMSVPRADELLKARRAVPA